MRTARVVELGPNDRICGADAFGACQALRELRHGQPRAESRDHGLAQRLADVVFNRLECGRNTISTSRRGAGNRLLLADVDHNKRGLTLGDMRPRDR